MAASIGRLQYPLFSVSRRRLLLAPATTTCRSIALRRQKSAPAAPLPPLPVPPLDATLRRYVEAIAPPLLDAQELQRARKLVDAFAASSAARELQATLEERARRHENWVRKRWQETFQMKT